MRRKIPLCHAARQGRHDDPFKISNTAIKRSAGLKTRRLGRLAGVRIARAAHDDAESGGMHSIHAGNPSTTRATPPDPISNVRQPQMVNMPIVRRAAVWENNAAREGQPKTFRRHNHHLEPIRQALLPFTFSPSPAIPLDDRCRIGQHLN